MTDKLFEKMLSGRFIFTVVSAFIFAYVSVRGIIKPEDIEKILLIVVYAYFTKTRKEEEQ